MDWFCWENLHRETMVFTMKLIGVSGSNFPIIQFHETTSKQMRWGEFLVEELLGVESRSLLEIVFFFLLAMDQYLWKYHF